MEIKRGDVVLMVVSRDLGRPRPGVVVQADQFGKDFSTVFVCPMTTDVQENLLLRPLVDPDPENGLRLRAQVMIDKMAAIRREQIRDVIGQIDDKTAEEIDRALLVILGLTNQRSIQ